MLRTKTSAEANLCTLSPSDLVPSKTFHRQQEEKRAQRFALVRDIVHGTYQYPGRMLGMSSGSHKWSHSEALPGSGSFVIPMCSHGDYPNSWLMAAYGPCQSPSECASDSVCVQ